MARKVLVWPPWQGFGLKRKTAMNKDHTYIPHSDVEYFGFAITDATIESGERIWVGVGMEGRWLTSMEVRELAAALAKVANAHDARSA